MIIMQNYTKLPRRSRFILLPVVCNIEITRVADAIVTDDVGGSRTRECGAPSSVPTVGDYRVSYRTISKWWII